MKGLSCSNQLKKTIPEFATSHNHGIFNDVSAWGVWACCLFIDPYRASGEVPLIRSFLDEGPIPIESFQ